MFRIYSKKEKNTFGEIENTLGVFKITFGVFFVIHPFLLQRYIPVRMSRVPMRK